MSKKITYPKAEEIFEEIPIDEFLSKNISKLPKMDEKVKNKLLEDAKLLSELGMESKKPEIHKPTKKALYDIFNMENAKNIWAYPNYDYYMYIKPTSDLNKWIKAAREIYYRVYKGTDKGEATNQIIDKWDDMEKMDFKNWMKFYEEGAHLKYKTAQVSYWEDANRAGYFVPIHPEPPKPTQPINNVSQMQNQETHPDIMAEEKRNLIERQRAKIIGRLDSAEKLLRSHEGQTFAGNELEAILEAIYQLKKKIQMVNKMSISTRLYEDMIVREANLLTKQGFSKAADVLHKVAQAMPAPTEPANPTTNMGVPNTYPAEGPGLTPPGAIPTDSAAPTDPTGQSMPPQLPAGMTPKDKPLSEGMKEFLKGLDIGKNTFIEDDKDVLEVSDADDLTVEAQIAPPSTPLSPEPAIEVADETAPSPEGKDFDNLIDDVLANVSIEDVVNKLDDVTKIFKVKEMSRQLAIIDMMLDRLGLVSMFPELAEASQKSFESSNYILSRLEGISARLKGATKSRDIDLTGQNAPEAAPQAQTAKTNLEEAGEKEKAQKAMRKQVEQESLMNKSKPKPEVEMAADLGQPTQLVSPPAPMR